MKQSVRKIITKAVIFSTFALATISPNALAADTPNSTISVTGEAQQIVAPTYALLTLGTSTQDMNLETAKSNSDKVMSDLLVKLSALGIQKKDIRTSNISIRPAYDYINSKRVNKGYTINNQIFIKINNLNNVNKVINSAVSVGINDISSLKFNSDITQQQEDKLSTDAIKDGQHQAEVTASALGRSLGEVKSITLHQSRTSNAKYEYDFRPSKGSGNVDTSNTTESGTVTITKTANMSYYLK